jgi:hypothetical protein
MASCAREAALFPPKKQPAPPRPRAGLRHKDTSITEALEDRALRQAALREAQEGLGPEDPCHTEEHAEFGGDFVVKWGEGHLKVSNNSNR